MKKVILTLFAVALATYSYSQNDDQLTILNKYIVANNTGTKEAISQFIKETYEPNLYKKIDLEEHIKFYAMISEDFGQLKTIVYEKIEEKPLRLVVYLIKENENLLNKSINPAEILVVEMDLNEQNPKYLKLGLGLGPLVCESNKSE
jgi:hypothetical protein